MRNRNGHTNGHRNGPLPTSDGHHDRADTRMKIDAIRRNINQAITEDATTLLDDLAFLRECARACRGRTAAFAAKGVLEIRMALLKLGVEIDVEDDKRERLDTGKATENVAHYDVRMPEASDRLGKALED